MNCETCGTECDSMDEDCHCWWCVPWKAYPED